MAECIVIITALLLKLLGMYQKDKVKFDIKLASDDTKNFIAWTAIIYFSVGVILSGWLIKFVNWLND